MSEAHRRPKNSEAVRTNLIAAAADLLSMGAPLSMGTVAEAAGVTKGAVQHHFGTREELLTAMCDAFLEHFNSVLSHENAQDLAPGGEARAYVRATVRAGVDQQQQADWRAILVACVIERALAARWSERVAESRAKDSARNGNELIMRLAADGLWLSDLLGIYQLSSVERDALEAALLNLSPSAPKP